MRPVNILVEKQYATWVYPQPVADITAWASQHFQICDPSLHYALLWPERTPNPQISVLVAGRGTSQAAILAYTNPRASVIGIDLSAANLDCTKKLKDKHKLDNLELRQMDLHDVSRLNRRFDLVYCTGVLHHLPEPGTGLKALASAVEDDGVLCLMLYAKYPRTGVYMVQSALNRLALGQTPADVKIARDVISSLPPGHLAQPYIRGAATDLAYDGGIVDTFLHPQDRTFTVPDLLALVADCGLGFQGWIDNLDYYPDAAIPSDHPIHSRLMALPEEEQWAVVELLVQLSACHSFLVRKTASHARKARIDFHGPIFSQTIPARRHALKVTDDTTGTYLGRNWHQIKLQGLDRDLFLAIDGKTSGGEIIERNVAKVRDWEIPARHCFARMWRLGHLTFQYTT